MPSLAELGIALPPRRDEIAPAPSPAPAQSTAGVVEPFGAVPEHVKGRISGWGQPANLSTVYTDVSKLQQAIRQAERGNTYQLTTLYRDLVLGASHIQAEFAKRKMVVLGQPWSIQPRDKTDPQDVAACEAIRAMIEDCGNWDMGLSHLLDATLWPCAAAEKIYEPADAGSNVGKLGLRYRLKELFPVNPALFAYSLPYLAQGGFGLPSNPGAVLSGGLPNSIPLNQKKDNPGDTVFDPDSWEPTLRFYRTFPNGTIDFSWSNLYAPDPTRHVIHRANLLGGIWDNYGGPMRSLIFLWFLSISARDWWSRSMERYGSPFIVIYGNTDQVDTANGIANALQMSSKLNGLGLKIGSKAELKETNTSGMAEGYERFADWINDECSKVILGQTSSSKAKAGGGLGQGSAQLHSEVRDDIAMFDKKTLNDTLRKQVFAPFLKINGLTGRAPDMFFGGLDQADLQLKGQALATLYGAGIQPTEDSLKVIGEEFGYELERVPQPKIEPTGTAADKGRPQAK